ncbi:MAG: crotonase/enoyl-CoA hydratase family protein [Pseudomonadota bacterium]
MSQLLSISVSDHVAHVRLTRPEKRNALSPELFAEIESAIHRLRSEPGLRAVVLSGEGASFCAGLDLMSFAAQAGDLEAAHQVLFERDADGANLYQRICTGWRHVPVPVIAAVHGHCLGGGLQIALGCDIRIAAPATELSVMEIRWGLVPDMGISVTSRGLIAPDVLLELTTTGRVFDATEGHQLGLITRLDDNPEAAALKLAAQIAQGSPDAVRAAKRLFRDSAGMNELDALKLEAQLQQQLMGSPNQMMAVKAGMAGQSPAFVDPA